MTKGGNIYRVHFQNARGAQAIPLILADPAGLTNGAGEFDTLNISDSGSTAADAAVLPPGR